MLTLLRATGLFLILTLVASGCGSGPAIRSLGRVDGGGPDPLSRPKRWSILVYMDADGDLEEYAILNMNQMESVGSDANVNIVVQLDRAPGYDSSNGDWTDTRRYLVTRDNDRELITSPVMEHLGEVDMGRPESLRDFISWAVARYPAEHYALVVWNHGSGWRPRPASAPLAAGVPAKSRGILYDDTSNTYLTMAEFDAALDVPGARIDLLAMDASLMGMLEVCYEIRDRAGLIVSSEESPPGPGYPYDRILRLLIANPEMTPEELGRAFVSEHVAAYNPIPVTQALIRTSRLPALAGAVDRLAEALAQALPEHKPALDQARALTQSYAYPYYADLGDFAEKVRAYVPVPAAIDAAEEVLTALPGGSGGPVLFEAHAGSRVANSNGLSIYLPGPGQLFEGYGDLRFCRDFPAWKQLLERWLTRPD